MLIAIEGIDGSGKTSQCRILAERLGCRVVREPGSTLFAEKMRGLLLDDDLDVRTQVFGFMACRAELYRRWDREETVVSDRWGYSTFAYQHDLGLELWRGMTDFACHRVWPDVGILLRIPYSVMRDRLGNGSGDRFESRDGAWFEETIVRYDMLGLEVVDGALGIEEVGDMIWDIVSRRSEP